MKERKRPGTVRGVNVLDVIVGLEQ